MYNVLIRPLKREDALISYQWRNDPDIWKFTGHRPDKIITQEIELDWIQRVLNEKDSCRFAILVDNIYIGNIQITNITLEEEGEYHIFIGEKDYWGKGIASLATWQLLRYAKERLNLKRLYLFVNPLNKPAIKVYERCGFIKVSDKIKMVFDLSRDLRPTVSVFMITYNHEAYIRQAVESILCQKTNFDFDIVIGEDCSTDSTRSIVMSIADQYPGKFKLLLHEKNIGAMANQMAVFSACTGKYIAMCEGDDYWKDSLKLQTQITFLDANPEFSLCFHGAMEVYEDQDIPPKPFVNLSTGEYSGQDILLNWIVPTASVVFRNYPDLRLKYFEKYIFGDTPLFLKVCENGKIWYMNETMSVYRRHKNGSAANRKHYKQIINQLHYINLEFEKKYDKTVKHLISKKYFDTFREYYSLGSIKMLKHLFYSLYWDHTLIFTFVKRKVKSLLTNWSFLISMFPIFLQSLPK